MTANARYTDDDLTAVSDNPEWTTEDFQAAKPFREVFPDLAARIDDDRPESVQVPIDRDLVERFKAEGPDWELRLNRRLREAVLSPDRGRGHEGSNEIRPR